MLALVPSLLAHGLPDCFLTLGLRARPVEEGLPLNLGVVGLPHLPFSLGVLGLSSSIDAFGLPPRFAQAVGLVNGVHLSFFEVSSSARQRGPLAHSCL